MATTNAQPNIAALEKVMETVRSSREEAQKFAADPKAYLKSQGLPTEGLKVNRITSTELSDEHLQAVAGGGIGWALCGGPVFISFGISW
jgi:hypothetical protein